MEKLNLQEFVGQIAQQTKWTKKESDELLKAFLSVITEGLETNDQVKVKGFGTFKRLWNAPRQSVNIKTGEKFEIAGHYKVSFTPETELKELINKPYAHLATTYLDDEEKIEEKPDDRLNLSQLSNEAQGLMAIIDEIKSQNKNGEEKEEAAIIEEPVKKTQPEVLAKTREEAIPVWQEQPIEKKTKRSRRGCAIWLTILGLLLLLALLYYFVFATFKINFNLKFDVENKRPLVELSELLSSFKKGKADKDDIFNFSAFDRLENDIVVPNDSIDNQEVDIEETPEETPQIAPVNNNEYSEFLAEVVVGAGDNLMRFAYQYYGHTMFWVYIYEANRNRIANPNNVNLGTKLRIPKLDASLTDLSNPETELRVSEMRREILK